MELMKITDGRYQVLEKNKLVNKLFRNHKMKDVDFYVTNVTDEEVVGFWLTRGAHQMIYKSPDRIPLNKIVIEDWKEVIFS